MSRSIVILSALALFPAQAASAQEPDYTPDPESLRRGGMTPHASIGSATGTAGARG